MANRSGSGAGSGGYYAWDGGYTGLGTYGSRTYHANWDTGYNNPDYYNSGRHYGYYGREKNPHWYERYNRGSFNQGNYGSDYNDIYNHGRGDSYRQDRLANPYWTAPGPYTGRGPHGYQRSDERIKEEINDRLYQHGRIDASDIFVDVDGGEVTLSGSVKGRREKRLAEDIADSVPGVVDVNNHLHLQKRSQSTSY